MIAAINSHGDMVLSIVTADNKIVRRPFRKPSCIPDRHSRCASVLLLLAEHGSRFNTTGESVATIDGFLNGINDVFRDVVVNPKAPYDAMVTIACRAEA